MSEIKKQTETVSNGSTDDSFNTVFADMLEQFQIDYEERKKRSRKVNWIAKYGKTIGNFAFIVLVVSVLLLCATSTFQLALIFSTRNTAEAEFISQLMLNLSSEFFAAIVLFIILSLFIANVEKIWNVLKIAFKKAKLHTASERKYEQKLQQYRSEFHDKLGSNIPLDELTESHRLIDLRLEMLRDDLQYQRELYSLYAEFDEWRGVSRLLNLISTQISDLNRRITNYEDLKQYINAYNEKAATINKQLSNQQGFLADVLREEVSWYTTTEYSEQQTHLSFIADETRLIYTVTATRFTNEPKRLHSIDILVMGRVVNNTIVIEKDVTGKSLHQRLEARGIPTDNILKGYEEQFTHKTM